MREEAEARGAASSRKSGCCSCSSWTGPNAIGQQQLWVARQAGERTFPVCFTDASASVRRRDELTSEEPLGRGPSKGQVGGRCPSKCHLDQPILPWQGQGIGVLHNSPSPTLVRYGAVVKAETT